jgi:hypothetical protein
MTFYYLHLYLRNPAPSRPAHKIRNDKLRRIRKREESGEQKSKTSKGEVKSKGIKFLLKKLYVHVRFEQRLSGSQEYFQFFDRRGRWSRM